MNGKSGKKRNPRTYTKGELNKLIDSMCHPFFKDDPALILVDGLFHAMVEQNTPLTVRKFIIYNLPKLVDKILKGLKD